MKPMKIERDKVLAVLGRSYTGHLGFADLAEALDLSRRDHDKLRALLDAMVESGDVDAVGKGGYTLAKPDPLGARGRIRVHPAGYGFVSLPDGRDVFVPAKYRGGSLDGDEVQLSTWIGCSGRLATPRNTSVAIGWCRGGPSTT